VQAPPLVRPTVFLSLDEIHRRAASCGEYVVGQEEELELMGDSRASEEEKITELPLIGEKSIR
jgi:hypothetical protein